MQFIQCGASRSLLGFDHEPLTPDPQVAAAICAACHRKGVLTLVFDTFANVVRLLPPLVIGEACSGGLDVLATAIRGLA